MQQAEKTTGKRRRTVPSDQLTLGRRLTAIRKILRGTRDAISPDRSVRELGPWRVDHAALTALIWVLGFY
jgi:hypothetical protein